MDYAKHYKNLVSRAAGRTLVGYSERHHILPKCMGGGDEGSNLVDLTPREHFVAHQLLLKIHPNVRGLAYAAMLMSGKSAYSGGSRNYGWLRERYREAGRSKEHCENISKAKMGKATEAMRKPKSEKHKAALRKPKSPEHIAKIKELARTPEGRAIRSANSIGRTISPEQKAKQSRAMKGRPGPRKGIPMSEESKIKLSNSQKERLAKKRMGQ